MPPAPTFPGVLGRWHADPAVLLGVAVAAGLYLRGVLIIRRRHPGNPVPAIRVAAFLSGLAVIVVALESFIGWYDDVLFSLHMVQHVLLTMVAAPLLLLGAPVTVALRSLPARPRRVLQRVLDSWLLHVVTHPFLTWSLFAAVMWVTHFTGFFEAALEHAGVHQLEHLLFLLAAIAFWWPVLGVDPAPRRLSFPARGIYLFLAMPQNTFLSLAIWSASSVRYPRYAQVVRNWGGSPLADQHAAGGIMWVAGDLVFLVALVAVMAMWARHEDRMNVILDAQLDEQLRLSPDGRPPWPRTATRDR